MITPKQQASTDDTTLDDEYEITRLDSLPSRLRDLAGLHAVDQLESVPPYIQRFAPEEKANGR